MRRGTTATHTISTGGIDLSSARVFITYVQGANKVLDITNDDSRVTVSSTAITVALTQEDTLSFVSGAVGQVQVRYIFESGEAGASGFMTFTVDNILKDGEIAFTDPTITLTGDATVAAGSDITLTATTDPSGLEVSWDTSDSDVATVEDGVVTGVAAGTATITATLVAYPDISATKSITVTAAEADPGND